MIQKLAFGSVLFVTLSVSAFYLKEHPELRKRIYSSEQIHVKITGQIKSPGIYKMESGSTGRDLIEKAGGLLPHAEMSLEDDSLEQLLVDGQAIDLGKR